ncbi:MAG: sulfotransferase domain-containing protein [Verrucomicrobiota bacterium JB023]|nr:sulfotransferase domain-containing protein [Verrucomicrobiota bacterium JB023]
MNKIDFIIVGAQKSASSFLHDCVASCPKVHSPSGETAVFESPEWEKGSLKSFLSTIEEIPEDHVFGIKRPNNLCIEDVPERIAKTFPKTKIVVVLRNPLDRFNSAFHHYIADGFWPPVPLNKGVQQLLDRTQIDKWKRAEEIVNFSLYSPGLQRYIKKFGKNQCYFTTHDDIVKNASKEIEKALEFIGVTPDFNKDLLNLRPQKVEYGVMRLRWTTLRNRFLYTYNSDRTRLAPRPEKSSTNQIALKAWTYCDRVVRKVIPPHKAEKPSFNEESLKRLAPLFINDIEETESLTGLDLSSWKNDPRMRAGLALKACA